MQPLILTNIGLAKLASATPEDQLEIKHIAVGDGGGGYPPIDPTMTALVNEVWRGDSSAPIRDPESDRVLIFETIIPNNEGGFTIREVGLFDVDGDMIAIGQIDEIEKTDGSLGTTPVMLTLRVRLTLENASQTDLIIADSPIVDHQGTSNRDAADAHPIEAITGLRGELDALSDHQNLINRNAPDAHPIEAITGLTAELGLKANTADLGSAAYGDVVSDEDDTTPGQLITTEWRGLNLTKRWQFTTATGPWQKFATVRGGSFGDHGVFFIDRLSRSTAGPLSARIEFSGYSTSGVFRARSFVSDFFSALDLGDIAYHHIGDDVFDLYVSLAADLNPVVEFTGSPGSLINTDPIPGVISLPPDAVIVPRSIDWNSQSMDQSWQDMTASRALDTTYTNSTGRPIHVSVTLEGNTAGASIYGDIRVDGVIIAESRAHQADGATNGRCFLYSIVPPGSTYYVFGGANAQIRRWQEYR